MELKCPDCGTEIYSRTARFCPECNASLHVLRALPKANESIAAETPVNEVESSVNTEATPVLPTWIKGKVSNTWHKKAPDIKTGNTVKEEEANSTVPITQANFVALPASLEEGNTAPTNYEVLEQNVSYEVQPLDSLQESGEITTVSELPETKITPPVLAELSDLETITADEDTEGVSNEVIKSSLADETKSLSSQYTSTEQTTVKDLLEEESRPLSNSETPRAKPSRDSNINYRWISIGILALLVISVLFANSYLYRWQQRLEVRAQQQERRAQEQEKRSTEQQNTLTEIEKDVNKLKTEQVRIDPSPSPSSIPESVPIKFIFSDKVAWIGEQYPETRYRSLDADYTNNLSCTQVRDAINELYARRGYYFFGKEAEKLRKHFKQFAWYTPDSTLKWNGIERKMSTTEMQNLKKLAEHRDELACKY